MSWLAPITFPVKLSYRYRNPHKRMVYLKKLMRARRKAGRA